MRRETAYRFALILVPLFLAGSSSAQEIPKGVNYKKASESVNAAAKSALENALTSESTPLDFFGDVTVCGPMLWKVLKPNADPVMLKAKPVIANIQNPEPIVAEAKGILKDDERQSFWRSLKNKYPLLKSAKIRLAHADEISFYWATIPFDIEEPFFVVETDAERFVAHLQNKNGKVTLFWIDLVGDLRVLKSK
jgi:hypothetical protein